MRRAIAFLVRVASLTHACATSIAHILSGHTWFPPLVSPLTN